MNGGCHGNAARHRFDEGNSEVFGVGRQNKHRAIAQESQLVTTADLAKKIDAGAQTRLCTMASKGPRMPSSGPAMTRWRSGRDAADAANAGTKRSRPFLKLSRPRKSTRRLPACSGWAARLVPGVGRLENSPMFTPFGTTTPGVPKNAGAARRASSSAVQWSAASPRITRSWNSQPISRF